MIIWVISLEMEIIKNQKKKNVGLNRDEESLQ